MTETIPHFEDPLLVLPKHGELEHGHELTEVERLDTFIHDRAGEALEAIEFEATPELNEAVKGFYHDHYYLAGAVSAVAEGRYDSELFTAIVNDPNTQDWEKQIGTLYPSHTQDREYSSPNARVAAYRLAKMAQEIDGTKAHTTEEQVKEQRFNALRQCGVALNQTLFREVAVGITTISDTEILLASELAQKIKAETNGRKIWEVPADSVSFPDGDTVERLIKSDIETFWADTRHAGQLEFHGTGNLDGINLHGLMSRNQQVRKTGGMRAQTALNYGGDTMHSVVPHFSEFYGMGGYVMGESGGTIAVPLAKIINKAPYARDARYAMVLPKQDDTEEKVPMPTLTKPTGRVGAGKDDTFGKGGLDRVFFSSADETSDTLPDDYEIDLFDKSNKPATYIVDRTMTLHNPKRELHELGVGYGFPERLIVDPDTDVEVSIQKLQADYFEAYNHRGIVVPLRRGVFAQIFENLPVDQGKGRNKAKIYNRYTPGSKVGAA
jgi:hypothetical protein